MNFDLDDYGIFSTVWFYYFFLSLGILYITIGLRILFFIASYDFLTPYLTYYMRIGSGLFEFDDGSKN